MAWGLLVLLCGLAGRAGAAFLAVRGGGNNARERLFVALAWLPKATVQAAMGPLALGKAREELARYLAPAPGTTCTCTCTCTCTGTCPCTLANSVVKRLVALSWPACAAWWSMAHRY